MVEFPGEKLVIKMWESIVDNGIGSLLSPWHERRMSSMRREERSKEIVDIAKAKTESMRLMLLSPHSLISNDADNSTNSSTLDRDAKKSKLDTAYLMRADEIFHHENMQRELNLGQVLLHTEDLLAEDSSPPSDEAIDPDWLFRWREHASKISRKEVQELWGRLLAGQVKTPSTYSMRAVEFLKDIDANEARLIEELKSFILDESFIYAGEGEQRLKNSLNFDKLLELQNLGILAGVDALGLQRTIPSRSNSRSEFVLFALPKIIFIEKDEHDNALQLPVLTLTRLGREILSLCIAEANETYLFGLISDCQARGYTCFLAHGEKLGESIQFSGKHEIAAVAR